MPARSYYFGTNKMSRGGKTVNRMPSFMWKGSGAYYLRGDRGDRYWAKRDIKADAARSRPKKSKNVGYGVYSQYHDRGTGKNKTKKITLTKYPNTNPTKKPSQRKISRATQTKRKATTKRKTVKRKTVKRKAPKRKLKKR